MEPNEIMEAQQEVIETAAEEITRSGAGKTFKVAAGVGLTVLTGVIVYKFVVKPAVAKHKGIFKQADVVQSDAVIIDVESDDAGNPEESAK